MQCVHVCGLSPVCMREWAFKCPFILNDLSHCGHLCGFSPEWIRECVFKLLVRLNDLLHCSQKYFWNPLWMRLWRKRPLLLANVFGHKPQDIWLDILSLPPSSVVLHSLFLVELGGFLYQLITFTFAENIFALDTKTLEKVAWSKVYTWSLEKHNKYDLVLTIHTLAIEKYNKYHQSIWYWCKVQQGLYMIIRKTQ